MPALWYTIYMTRIQVQAEINKIKNVLVERYRPERIILFGSYAWGKPNPDSDLDFLIIKDIKIPRPAREQEVYKILTQYFRNRNMPVDVIVHTPKETQNRIHLGDPFIKEVLHKGRVIYEQS